MFELNAANIKQQTISNQIKQQEEKRANFPKDCAYFIKEIQEYIKEASGDGKFFTCVPIPRSLTNEYTVEYTLNEIRKMLENNGFSFEYIQWSFSIKVDWRGVN